MNAIPSLTISPLDQARAAMEQMARAAVLPENARGWWHAARIVRTFGNAGRAMKQQAQMARFFATSVPEKARAYREAMVILARHTGEPIVVREVPVGETNFAFADTLDEGVEAKVRCSAKKKRKMAREYVGEKRQGSGSIGWVAAGNRGGPVVVAGSSGASHSSYRSRSSLHGPDLFLTEFIPFIGG